jgi:hypothetical protein
MSEFKDKMCVCKDKACADKVVDEMTKWSSEMAKNADRDESQRRGHEEDVRRDGRIHEVRDQGMTGP